MNQFDETETETETETRTDTGQSSMQRPKWWYFILAYGIALFLSGGEYLLAPQFLIFALFFFPGGLLYFFPGEAKSDALLFFGHISYLMLIIIGSFTRSYKILYLLVILLLINTIGCRFMQAKMSQDWSHMTNCPSQMDRTRSLAHNDH
ncbi:MAG: hypothetical protein NTX50_26800 [Candidatus Sumerlaeota bacterium]|nr:hypothetical protein [Candidatus Sumerlaeota bacterium]